MAPKGVLYSRCWRSERVGVRCVDPWEEGAGCGRTWGEGRGAGRGADVQFKASSSQWGLQHQEQAELSTGDNKFYVFV